MLLAEIIYLGFNTILHSPLGPLTVSIPAAIVSITLAYDAFRLVKRAAQKKPPRSAP